MGAGLQTSLGLRAKKETIRPKKVRLSELLVDGYDVNQLIQEYIVPIDGIICTHHIEADAKHDVDDGERESGHAQVIRINEMLRNLKYRRGKSFIEFHVPLKGHSRMTLSSVGFGKSMSGLTPKRGGRSPRKCRPQEEQNVEYHPEVCRISMCRAYMYAAEIDEDPDEPGNAAQDTACIDMTIHGYLFFPPFHTSERPHEFPPKKVLRLYPPEVELAQSSSKVAIQMPTRLHDPNVADDILGLLSADEHVNQLAPPRITCGHVEMARVTAEGGDPVLDAWLPVCDIERQIEFMLNEHMSEKLWHPN